MSDSLDLAIFLYEFSQWGTAPKTIAQYQAAYQLSLENAEKLHFFVSEINRILNNLSDHNFRNLIKNYLLQIACIAEERAQKITEADQISKELVEPLKAALFLVVENQDVLIIVGKHLWQHGSPRTLTFNLLGKYWQAPEKKEEAPKKSTSIQKFLFNLITTREMLNDKMSSALLEKEILFNNDPQSKAMFLHGYLIIYEIARRAWNTAFWPTEEKMDEKAVRTKVIKEDLIGVWLLDTGRLFEVFADDGIEKIKTAFFLTPEFKGKEEEYKSAFANVRERVDTFLKLLLILTPRPTVITENGKLKIKYARPPAAILSECATEWEGLKDYKNLALFFSQQNGAINVIAASMFTPDAFNAWLLKLRECDNENHRAFAVKLLTFMRQIGFTEVEPVTINYTEANPLKIGEKTFVGKKTFAHWCVTKSYNAEEKQYQKGRSRPRFSFLTEQMQANFTRAIHIAWKDKNLWPLRQFIFENHTKFNQLILKNRNLLSQAGALWKSQQQSLDTSRTEESGLTEKSGLTEFIQVLQATLQFFYTRKGGIESYTYVRYLGALTEAFLNIPNMLEEKEEYRKTAEYNIWLRNKIEENLGVVNEKNIYKGIFLFAQNLFILLQSSKLEQKFHQAIFGSFTQTGMLYEYPPGCLLNLNSSGPPPGDPQLLITFLNTYPQIGDFFEKNWQQFIKEAEEWNIMAEERWNAAQRSATQKNQTPVPSPALPAVKVSELKAPGKKTSLSPIPEGKEYFAQPLPNPIALDKEEAFTSGSESGSPYLQGESDSSDIDTPSPVALSDSQSDSESDIEPIPEVNTPPQRGRTLSDNIQKMTQPLARLSGVGSTPAPESPGMPPCKPGPFLSKILPKFKSPAAIPAIPPAPLLTELEQNRFVL